MHEIVMLLVDFKAENFVSSFRRKGRIEDKGKQRGEQNRWKNYFMLRVNWKKSRKSELH
jgi:hypothetical protein